MFVKALFIVMKDCKILHHPPKNYDKFKQQNTMQPLKFLLQKSLITWECSSLYRVKLKSGI